MIEQGLMVTVIGMSVVFTFLLILVCAMYLSSAIIAILNKFFPEMESQMESVNTVSSANEEIALAVAVVKMMKK